MEKINDNYELVAFGNAYFNTGNNFAVYVEAEGKGISIFFQSAMEGNI